MSLLVAVPRRLRLIVESSSLWVASASSPHPVFSGSLRRWWARTKNRRRFFVPIWMVDAGRGDGGLCEGDGRLGDARGDCEGGVGALPKSGASFLGEGEAWYSCSEGPGRF
jgi:hypothetical protein